MALSTLFVALFLVILLDDARVSCSPLQPSTNTATSEGSAEDSTFSAITTMNKPPLPTSSLVRVKSLYGFLENSCQDSERFDNNTPASMFNYWRITCPTYKYKLMVVVMSLHLSHMDYLQVKHLNMTGVVEKTFHSYYFNKRSILVALVGGKHRFSYSSSFLLSYICVDSNTKVLSHQLLQNPAVLKYMRCRPHTIKMVAKLITDPKERLNYISDVDWINITKLSEDPNAVLVDKLECTDDLNEYSGSAARNN